MTSSTITLNGPARPDDNTDDALSLDEFSDFFHEIEEQPAWRARADREMEYFDGNQLSAEILQRQMAIGMPPAIEPVIGPAINNVLGLEAKSRADWRVQPDGLDGDEVAKALNFKLNQAERHSKADQACSDAFKTQAAVGIGWVEVSRNPNPFQYPYRCKSIHRNEIWWDFLSTEPDLIDARYLIRRRWTPTRQVELMFPAKRDLIRNAASGWPNFDGMGTGALEGGGSTDLAGSWDQQRGWSIEEQQWRDGTGKRVCLFEVWYRRWKRVLVMKTPDGRVVEYNKSNPMHVQLVALKVITPEWAIVPKMRRSIWMGPHRLDDGPTPYRHQKFPYVPFWGSKEDRTGTPYGLVRGMIYMQDNINATNSRLRWGLAAVRTTRTKGVVASTDQQFRREVARIDADIVLKQEEMAKPGATFKVERDFQLSEQHWKMVQDSRDGIQRVSGITPSQQGTRSGATSGVQEITMVEQGNQAQADLNENFATARAEVGDLLLSLLVEDMIGKEETVVIKNPLKDDEEVRLNVPMRDDDGFEYLDNDVERTKLKVAVNDVPSTPSYRSQQLRAMSEAFKSTPPEFQRVLMPYLTALMDLPSETRDEIIKAVREAAKQSTPEEIEKRIQQAVADSRQADARDLKARELELRYPQDKLEAEVRRVVAETFKVNVEALYSANQTAATIAMNPAIAPVADAVAEAAGYQAPNPGGMDPNLPVPVGVPMPAVEVPGTPGVEANTSPALPPVPQAPSSPLQGIETQRTSDNAPV